jgi:hypothetical protein
MWNSGEHGSNRTTRSPGLTNASSAAANAPVGAVGGEDVGCRVEVTADQLGTFGDGAGEFGKGGGRAAGGAEGVGASEADGPAGGRRVRGGLVQVEHVEVRRRRHDRGVEQFLDRCGEDAVGVVFEVRVPPSVSRRARGVNRASRARTSSLVSQKGIATL